MLLEKIQALANYLLLPKLQNLSEEATLACFGAYYYEDVLKNPNGTDHQNIRNFMKTGWDGIAFYGSAISIEIK